MRSSKREDSLAARFPLLLKEWHPRNTHSPEGITYGSRKRMWWRGDCGHEWLASVNDRTSGYGCGVCRGLQVQEGVNDLLAVSPKIAAEWHPVLNLPLKPSEVTHGSGKKYWWLCPHGHQYQSSPANRKRRGCPVCAGHLVQAGFNDLASTHPELAAEWDSENNTISVAHITAGSGRRVWWRGICGHRWQQVISDRKKGRGCPVCDQTLILAGVNDLTTSRPDLAAEWHPKNSLVPTAVSAGAHKKVWWLGACGHEWEAMVYSRSLGKGCPVCAGKIVCPGFNDVASDPKLLAEWHPTKNDFLPTEITLRSGKRVWWLGPCGHEWQATANDRKDGHGCAVCSGHQIQLGVNDLATQNLDVATEWHPTKNNGLMCTEVTRASNRLVWWLGTCGHEWQARVADRKDHGCPSCATTHSGLEKFVESKLGLSKFNRKVLKEASYRPDLQLSDRVYMNVDGLYWHSELHRGRRYHADMQKAYVAEGLRVLQFYEDEILQKWDVVKSMIDAVLGRTDVKLDARKCEVVTVGAEIADRFFETNHLMGRCYQSHYVGLQNSGGELVSLLAYRKHRDQIEIVRSASILRTVVRGSFQRLLKYLRSQDLPIHTLVDLRYADGHSLEAAGFRRAGEYIQYQYTDGMTRRDKRAFRVPAGTDERRAAAAQGWYRIYDAGRRRYVLDVGQSITMKGT